MEEKVVHAHDMVRKLIEVIHYEDHPKRTDSEEFKAIREEFHKKHARCYIDNGFCEGPLEIHHAVIEWAAATEVDWSKVKAEHGFDHVDHIKNMLPLCHKHHQSPGFGVHSVTFPAWILQKYMKRDALEAFEKAVKHLIDQGHEDHHVNHAARKMLLHLSKARKDEAHDERKQRGVHQHTRNV